MRCNMNMIYGVIMIIATMELFNHEIISVVAAMLGLFFGLLIAVYPVILENEEYINQQNERNKYDK